MFLQPVLFFGAVLWAAGFAMLGLFMLFRRAATPVPFHDRLIACLAMVVIGVTGAAVVFGVWLILSELF